MAVASAALAIGAHGMAGGGTPDTALAVLLTMIVAWAGTSVAARHQGPFAVLTALGTAQLAMHLVLNYVLPTHTGHHTQPVAPAAMWATHVTATLLTAVLLANADRALSVVASGIRLLRDLVRPPTFAAVPGATYVLAASPQCSDHIRRVVLRKVHSRRGPPTTS
ncbi:hypothetical protein [Actinocrispum wychmicini]|uniref:Uncharacterized protein n=1 Tax=Actinocrispum wychmicini TaxID=1213861 RepID=A0A4R2JZ91_9PSEU|nr:hypothetical protein [Actinocrispum wychmicini]TCO64612.1 hypothetical protein EV192_101389 [Actinocrispum wychmicini]